MKASRCSGTVVAVGGGVLLLALALLASDLRHGAAGTRAQAAEPRAWYVSAAETGMPGDGSASRPFQAIQPAIDAAVDGDTVIVLEGRYAGPGNRDLNFRGKAIAVRSRNLDDTQVLEATLIDGEGQGVLVRFVNDEGPGTSFAGFTLVPGDTSRPVRGAPGFFEFSPSARPSIHHLRVASDPPPEQAAIPTRPDFGEADRDYGGPPYGGRAWDGFDPFHQPAATTDYYGSGDANNDGSFTAEDVALAGLMAQGSAAPSPRADADGSGAIDEADVTLLDDALNGGAALPGWWNELPDRQARDAWIDRVLARDSTNLHPYYTWFLCEDFSTQFYLNATYCRSDLEHTVYDGGQTRFNLPVYRVEVMATGYGHAINAVLVGDHPLEFADWRFLEPQTDDDVHPGNWDMPYDSYVAIQINDSAGQMGYLPGRPGYLNRDKVVFQVHQSGWTLEAHDPNLILNRQPPPTQAPDNRSDVWNPRVVPAGAGMLLFDRSRPDMSRVTDIYLSSLTAVAALDPPAAQPLTGAAELTRLLDLSQGPDGTLHLLWQASRGYTPGVYRGRLDVAAARIANIQPVATDYPALDVRKGRILATPGGDVFTFWLGQQYKPSAPHPMESGLFFVEYHADGSKVSGNLLPAVGNYLYPGSTDWFKRDYTRYFFDAALGPDGNPIVVYRHTTGYSSPSSVLRLFQYPDGWGTNFIQLDGSEDARGVDLAADDNGMVHMLYWQGPPDYGEAEGRGNLVYRYHPESWPYNSWSYPQVLDDTGGACCGRLAAGPNGDLYATWERRVGDRVVSMFSHSTAGQWSASQVLQSRPGADGWYPTVDVLADGRPVYAWSSRSPDLATAEWRIDPHPGLFYLPVLMARR